MTRLLVATRSAHKLRELRQLFLDLPELSLLDLQEAGVEEDAREEEIESFPTFAENALAKARYFAELTALPVLADDSGLCVDALGGAPGVRSKRFSPRSDLHGTELDAANNALLLERLQGVPRARRGAHFQCVIALATPEGASETFSGRCDGRILTGPRGENGFGYDPLFFLPELDASLAELDAAVKNRISHRARAADACARALAAGWLARH